MLFLMYLSKLEAFDIPVFNYPAFTVSSIENLYVDITLSLMGRLFPPDLFEMFIDVGHYVRELNAYKPLVDKISTLTVNIRGILAR